MAALRRPRRERGRSLIELVVTAMLLAMLAVGIMKVGPSMSGNARKLEARARSIAELRMATEYLLQDFGGTAEATLTLNGHLHLVRNKVLAERLGAWQDGGDAGILYELDDDGVLSRVDLALDRQVVVARELTAFEVSEDTDVETRIRLASGQGLGERSLQLVWNW